MMEIKSHGHDNSESNCSSINDYQKISIQGLTFENFGRVATPFPSEHFLHTVKGTEHIAIFRSH